MPCGNIVTCWDISRHVMTFGDMSHKCGHMSPMSRVARDQQHLRVSATCWQHVGDISNIAADEFRSAQSLLFIQQHRHNGPGRIWHLICSTPTLHVWPHWRQRCYTNMITVAISKLTQCILLQQDDWDDWKQSEFTQLDMYATQHMFGEPCPFTKKCAAFNLIWTYIVK
jgi:hypothetical protein